MDNISFSKNMASYPMDDQLVTRKKIIFPVKSININLALSLDVQIALINDVIYNIDDIYKQHAHKELYDVKIYLAMVKGLLKNIK